MQSNTFLISVIDGDINKIKTITGKIKIYINEDLKLIKPINEDLKELIYSYHILYNKCYEYIKKIKSINLKITETNKLQKAIGNTKNPSSYITIIGNANYNKLLRDKSSKLKLNIEKQLTIIDRELESYRKQISNISMTNNETLEHQFDTYYSKLFNKRNSIRELIQKYTQKLHDIYKIYKNIEITNLKDLDSRLNKIYSIYLHTLYSTIFNKINSKYTEITSEEIDIKISQLKMLLQKIRITYGEKSKIYPIIIESIKKLQGKKSGINIPNNNSIEGKKQQFLVGIKNCLDELFEYLLNNDYIINLNKILYYINSNSELYQYAFYKKNEYISNLRSIEEDCKRLIYDKIDYFYHFSQNTNLNRNKSQIYGFIQNNKKYNNFKSFTEGKKDKEYLLNIYNNIFKEIVQTDTLSSSDKQRILGNLNLFLSNVYLKISNKDISELTTNMSSYLAELKSLNNFEKIKQPKYKKEKLNLRVSTNANISRQINNLEELKKEMFSKKIPSLSFSNLKKYTPKVYFNTKINAYGQIIPYLNNLKKKKRSKMSF